VAGKIVEQLDHQVQLSETFRQVLFVVLVRLNIGVQTLEEETEN